jgi:hypothetical protein
MREAVIVSVARTPIGKAFRGAFNDTETPVLAGHAAFETYSVLTRMPIPLRLSADQAVSVLAAAFPGDCWLDPAGMRELRERLAVLDIVGGSVYDALVGQASVANGRTLLTRDRRAERTYRSLQVEYRFVG